MLSKDKMIVSEWMLEHLNSWQETAIKGFDKAMHWLQGI